MINDDIIKRVLASCASDKEAAEVAEFFATDKGQRKLMQMMDSELLNLESGATPIADSFQKEEIYRQVMKAIRRRKVRRTVWQFAAVLVPIAVVAGTLTFVNRNVAGGHMFERNEMTQVTVPAGDKMKVVFHDGSSVYLNAGSTLSYPVKFGLKSRDVTLEGEGYFEVSKNPSRPFSIHFKDGNVKVYGTSFNLSAYDKERMVSLSLDSGSVAMEVGGQNYDITPGQVLYYDRREGIAQLVNGGNLFKSRWREGIITFKSASLQDIINTLSRTFAIDFTLSKDIDTTVLYTFTSSSRNLDVLLDELAIIAPVSISKESATNVRLEAR